MLHSSVISFLLFTTLISICFAGSVGDADMSSSCAIDAHTNDVALDGYSCNNFNKINKTCFTAECAPEEGSGNSKYAVCDHGRIVTVVPTSRNASDFCAGHETPDTSIDRSIMGVQKDSSSRTERECTKILAAIKKLKEGDNSQDGSIAYWQGKAQDSSCRIEPEAITCDQLLLIQSEAWGKGWKMEKLLSFQTVFAAACPGREIPTKQQKKASIDQSARDVGKDSGQGNNAATGENNTTGRQ